MMKQKKIFLTALLSILTAFAWAQDAEQPVRRTNRGIIVVPNGAQTRAFEPFSGKTENGIKYAEAVNAFAKAFEGQAKVYIMTIPNAVAFYCPQSVSEWTKDEKQGIDNIYHHLSKEVIQVDAYGALLPHVEKPIYLRTDHHWAPLGAYYATEAFAQKANVTYRNLNEYEPRTLSNFVGTMYKFSGDIAVKNAPEDFVYYVPKDSNYSATFIKYQMKGRSVIGESKPTPDHFFYSYKNGSSLAYMTFMGGDARTVSIKTNTKNGRYLMILKDSYGNAIPGYLFGSFEEIHVVDFRYFHHSIKDFVIQNKITDILFANNLIHAYSPSTSSAYQKLLVRND